MERIRGNLFQHHRASGLSLIELLIALSIVAMAMGMMVWNILYGPIQQDAAKAETKQLEATLSGMIREANSRLGSLILTESGHLPQALLEYGISVQDSGESTAWGSGSKWYRVGNLKIDLPAAWDEEYDYGHNEPGFLVLVRDNKNEQVLGSMVVNVKGDVHFIPNKSCGAFEEAPPPPSSRSGGSSAGGTTGAVIGSHPCLEMRPLSSEIAGRRGEPIQTIDDPPPVTDPESSSVTLPDPSRRLPEIPGPPGV